MREENNQSLQLCPEILFYPPTLMAKIALKGWRQCWEIPLAHAMITKNGFSSAYIFIWIRVVFRSMFAVKIRLFVQGTHTVNKTNGGKEKVEANPHSKRESRSRQLCWCSATHPVQMQDLDGQRILCADGVPPLDKCFPSSMLFISALWTEGVELATTSICLQEGVGTSIPCSMQS